MLRIIGAGILVALLATTARADAWNGDQNLSDRKSCTHSCPTNGRLRLAFMCIKTGEQVSGMNRICFYSCAGSQAAITVGAAELCPLSIDR